MSDQTERIRSERGIRWTPDEDAILVRLWAERRSAAAIAAAIPGRTARQVTSRAAAIRDRCPATRAAPVQPQWMPADDLRLRQMYEGGARRADIAERLERTWSACQARIYALGLRRPDYGRAERDQRLLDLVRAGALVADAAQQMGISATVAYQALYRLRKRGIDVPDAAAAARDEAVERAMRALRRLRSRRALDPGAIDTAALPWLAGVLDARGSIQINKAASPEIILTTSRRALVAQCWLATGLGSIRREIRPRCAVIWRWATTAGDDSIRLLRLLIPHLRARRGLAQLCAEWPLGGRGYGAGLPAAIVARRAELAASIAHWRAIEDLPPAHQTEARP